MLAGDPLSPDVSQPDAGPAPPPHEAADLARVLEPISVGLLRIDAGGHAWPLNELGAAMLASLAGASGEALPASLQTILAAARRADGPEFGEVILQRRSCATSPSPSS